jgi:PIN domain nuclease of toxin-antitoxin system
VSLLLDTHVLLWWLTDDERLPDRMRAAVRDADVEVHVSAASAWEASSKSAVGKLTLPDRWWEHVREQRLTELPVTAEDALVAGALPRHHADPFDRMLIAQAVRRDLTLLTVDHRFGAYDVRLFA